MIFSLDEMMKMMDDKEENLRKVLEIIKRYQKLELTGEENVLVGALALMNAGITGHMVGVMQMGERGIGEGRGERRGGERRRGEGRRRRRGEEEEGEGRRQ